MRWSQFGLYDWNDRVSVVAMGIFFYCLFTLAIVVLVSLRFYSRRLRLQANNPATNTKTIAIGGILVSLEINEKRSLFVLVDEDGLINRLGSGTFNITDQHLFIGKSDLAVFQAVRSQMTEAMLQMTGGTFAVKNPRGTDCKLKILWQFKDGTSGGFVFYYGAESKGPPAFVANFVRAAVGATDRWHDNFKPAQREMG